MLSWIKIQDAEGNFKDSWGETVIRVTDLAITPDLTHIVAVGIHYHPASPSVGALSPDSRPTDTSASPSGGGNGSTTGASRKLANCMIVYDLATKQTELFVSLLHHGQRLMFPTPLCRSIPLEGELSSVKISRDSRYALVNHPQDVSFTPQSLVDCSDIHIFPGNILVRSQHRKTGT